MNMSVSGLQLPTASLGPSTNQRPPLAHRFHLSLHGRAPSNQGQSRQQIQCRFKKDDQQEGGLNTVFPQAQVLTKTALRKYPKAKLQEELRVRDLDTLGNKQDLVERLHAALTVFLVEEHTAAEPPSPVEKRGDSTVPHLAGSAAATFETNPDILSVSLETDNSLAALLDLTKRDLQQALVERGLPKTGNKTDLAQRLFAALEEERSVLLAEQMEAGAELQRQYQEAAATSAFRRPGVTEITVGDEDGDEDEEFSRWAAEIEGEKGNYEMAGQDTEEDMNTDDTASTEMALQDTEWRRIDRRPSQIMEMFEHQGTAAAELASEDYAHHNRAERIHSLGTNEGQAEEAPVEDPQDFDDDMNPSITGSRSGRQQQVGAFGEDPDRFDTDNELEDGFSFVSEDADGFDSDAEERLAQLEDDRRQQMGRQPESAHAAKDPFSPRHRNFQNFSARSPDDFEDDGPDEDKDVLAEDQVTALVTAVVGEGQSQEGTLAGTGKGAAAVSGAAADGEAAFLGRATPPNPVPPSTGSKISIPGGGGKGKGASQRPGKTALTAGRDFASAVVASQGVSSLDDRTALEWMRSRLPEAAQLLDTPAAQPISSAVGDLPGATQQVAGAEGTAEDSVEAAQSRQAAGAVQPEQLAEELAVLETDSAVQPQGFELAAEDAQAAAAQLEVTVMSEALPTDAAEQAQEPSQSTDSPAAPADAQAVMAAAGSALAPAEEEATTADVVPEAEETAVSAAEEPPIAEAQEAVEAVLGAHSQSEADVVRAVELSAATQLPQQAEVAALQDEMKQKQEAVAALQSRMEAAGNGGDDNSTRIASLQAALVELQSQQLAWQRDNLSERLAALLEAASQATLNTTVKVNPTAPLSLRSTALKDELKGQLEAMRGELTQLEADLSSRDTEAAKLSSALADARAKLGGSEAAPAGHNRIPGSIQVKLDMNLGQLAGTGSDVDSQTAGKPELPFPSTKVAPAQPRSSKPDARKPSFDAGLALAAGVVGAVKLVSGLFGLGAKPKCRSGVQAELSNQKQSSMQEPGKQDEKGS